MSKFHTYATEYKDGVALVQALKEIGYAAEVHAEAQHLYGFQGDQRKETAEIIVRRAVIGGASNDIGFKRGETGSFGALISEYDSCRHGDHWLKTLKQEYAIAKETATAKKLGYKNIQKVVTKTAEGRKIVLTCNTL